MQGVLAVSGVIGTWAGPRSPGTAYVMAHHKIGDVGDGQTRIVGLSRRRHGRGQRRAARGRESPGATVRTDAPVARIVVRERPRPRRDARVGRGAARRRRDRGHPPEDHVPRADRARRAARRLRRRDRALEDAQRHGEGERRGRPPARVHRQARLRPRGPRRHDRARRVARPGRARVPRRRRRPCRRRSRSPTSASLRCSTARSRP